MSKFEGFGQHEALLVHAYVDDELDETERKEFEARLHEDETLRELANAYSEQKKALHDEFDGVLEEEIPGRLMEAVRIPGRSKKRPHAWKTMAMAASILVSVTVGWFANEWFNGDTATSTSGRTLAEQAVLAHFMYSVSVRRNGPMTENQQAALIGRVSRELGSAVRPPNLQQAGYWLAGGRILPADIHDKAAQFMYEGRNNNLLTLYVRSGLETQGSSTAYRYIEEAAVGVFYWMRGGLGYGLAGHMGHAELAEIAHVIQGQNKLQ